MLDMAERNLLDTVAGTLLRSVDHHHEAGDNDAALLFSDVAEAALALLDADHARCCADKSEAALA